MSLTVTIYQPEYLSLAGGKEISSRQFYFIISGVGSIQSCSAEKNINGGQSCVEAMKKKNFFILALL